jgi:hypothetical protein
MEELKNVFSRELSREEIKLYSEYSKLLSENLKLKERIKSLTDKRKVVIKSIGSSFFIQEKEYHFPNGYGFRIRNSHEIIGNIDYILKRIEDCGIVELENQ